MERDAKFLAAHPYMKLLISGHCDERGSEEYNLTLGDGRADTVATSWSVWESRLIAFAPSATAKKSHSARRRRKRAGR